MRDNDSVEARLKRLEDDTRALKGAQFIGFDSVRAYKIETENTWDIDWTPTFGPPQTGVFEHLYMKFTADNQDAPMCNMYIKVLINNSIYYRVSASDDPTGDNGVNMNGTVRDSFGNYSPTPAVPNTSKEVSWYDTLGSKISGTNIKAKFIVYATDTGKLTIAFGDTLIIKDNENVSGGGV